MLHIRPPDDKGIKAAFPVVWWDGVQVSCFSFVISYNGKMNKYLMKNEIKHFYGGKSECTCSKRLYEDKNEKFRQKDEK